MMIKLLSFIIFLVGFNCSVRSEIPTSKLATDDTKIYDRYGKYKGKITIEGKIFNPYGKYKGKITKDGKIYSPYGKYLGIIKK